MYACHSVFLNGSTIIPGSVFNGESDNMLIPGGAALKPDTGAIPQLGKAQMCSTERNHISASKGAQLVNEMVTNHKRTNYRD